MSGIEKSSFAMTCNRLSSFLKEKGGLKNISINAPFDVKGKLESALPRTETNMTTVDLLSKMESSVNMLEKNEKSINHLPQYVSVDSFCKPDDLTSKSVSSETVTSMESKTAQMTILYRGQVFVFDCVSADKARDMMLAAAVASSSNNNNIQIQNRVSSALTSDCSSEGYGSRYRILPRLQLNGLDLPIARRSSLHKFLAKRKERASERAPYQLHNHKFDLNL